MAAPTGTLQTYQAKGIRENLKDVIYNIAPTDTPFLSAIDSEDCDNTFFEWQTDTLDAAANNAQIEGDDTTFAALTPTARIGNYCQISRKGYIVSGTQERVQKAGRKSELNYQRVRAGKGLKRDMEVALCQNTTFNAGAAATARQTRGLEGWIATNNSLGASGVAPNPVTNTAPTDGTQRAFTEALLQVVAKLCWDQGGKPNMLMVGSAQKQTASGFTGGTTKFNDMESGKKLFTAIDVYVSDFGSLKIVPNRFQRARTAFLLETEKWKLRTLRDIHEQQLAKTGDAEKRQLVCEYGLESSQEAASGAVRDLL